MIKPKFDELIHAPTRLSLVSLLAATEWADFKFLRDSAGLSDSALSKQLTTLEDAGYIEIRKGFVGKWPRTSARLTSVGRAAFDQHVAALQHRWHSLQLDGSGYGVAKCLHPRHNARMQMKRRKTHG